MTIIQKTIGRLPVNLGDYDSTRAYGKKNRVTLYDCEWESKVDNNTYPPATLVNGVVTPDTTHWRLNSGVPGNYGLDAEIGTDNQPGTIKGRIKSLEDSVGTGGTVDQKIASAVQTEATRATGAETALGNRVTSLENEVGSGGGSNTLSSRVTALESGKADKANTIAGYGITDAYTQASGQALEDSVAAALAEQDSKIDLLNGSEVVVVADHTAVSDPDDQTIYRQYGTTSYTDWMYQNGAWQDIATYSMPGIDNEPTAGSNNLVKSGGVYPTKAAVESITKKNNNLLDINKLTIGSYLNPIYHNIVENADFFSTPRIAVEEGQVLYFNRLGKLVVFKSGAYDKTLDDNANNIEGPWTVPAGVTEIQMTGFVDILGVDDPYISVGVNVREPYGYQLITSDGVEEDSSLPVKSKDVYDFVGDAVEDIESQIESPEVLYAEVDSGGRGLRELTKDAEIHHLPQVFGDKVILTKKAYDSLIESMDSYGIHQISKIELGTTQAVFSSEDPDASPLEDIRSQNQTIIKYNGMYYMWYLACGTNGYQFWDIPNTAQYAKYAWMFAYSTDGVNWHREFPAGVTPPWGSEYPNSIKILKNDGTIDNSAEFGTVFIVKDSEYPFRCMCAGGYLTMKMSRDGFTWDKSVVIDRTQYRDCDCGVVIRNNIMKIYTRGWTGNYPPEKIHGYGSRIIVVLYADLDGNLICPAVPFSDLNSNYESGVAVIDDRRELLFTPLYRGESYPVIAVPYIVDGARVKQLKINNAYLLDNDTWKSIWWRNGMFYENGKFYCYYYACDKVHNDMASPTAKTKLFRVEVKLLSNIRLNNENLI